MSSSEQPSSGPPSGAERAAILLMSLGEEQASQVLKHLNPREVQQLGSAMATLGSVSRQQMQEVIADFTRAFEDQTNIGVGADDYLKRVLNNALGENKAANVLDRILKGGSTNGVEALKWMDARAVAEVVRNEHPQIVAIILSHIDPDHAAEVLLYLPQNLISEVMIRIARLETIQPTALRELDEMLEKQFAGRQTVQSSGVGGVKSAGNIMNFLDSSVSEAVMAEIENLDAEMSTEIQESMFVFDNLTGVDDRGIQSLLREIQTESLITALKGAEEGVREKFFKNMSKRAAETLREDLDAKGPVRLADVETAQKEIVATARRMADAGEISLGNQGGETYV